MQRRDFLKTAVAGVAGLSTPRLSAAESIRVLRFRPNNDLTVLDPIWTSVFVTRHHGFMVFDTLYGQDDQMRPHPQMVEGHRIENDGKLWRLTLREGLKFHDGEPVLARDVVASIRRWARADAFGQALMAATDELSAISDREVKFRLRRPFPLLPNALGKGTTFMPAIMPERLARADLSRPLTEAVGSGPYRFVAAERIAGVRAVYERFRDYVPRQGGQTQFTSGPKIAHFDRIEWITIPDPATAAAALRTGEIDWYEDPMLDLLPTLRRDRSVVVDTINPAGNMGIIRLNHLHPPFDNPAVRRAILGAINQTELMAGIAGSDRSLWDDKVGIFCPESPLASDAGLEVLTSPRDPAKVRRDLEQAGYRGEPVVFLTATNSVGINALAEVASDQFRRNGINVEYVALDFGNWLQRRNRREPPSQGGWNVLTTFLPGMELWDPAGHLALRGNGQNAWSGWPTSARIEELRDAWFMAKDDETRRALGREMQLQAWQDVPYIPAGRWKQPTAYRRDLTGVLRGIPLFYNVRRV